MQHALLRRTLDGKGAEFRVFVADLSELFVLRVISPSLDFFHAVPHLDDGALRCLAIKPSYLPRVSPSASADGKEFPTMRLDERLCSRSIFLPVGLRVSQLDFRDVVYRRLRLRVRPPPAAAPSAMPASVAKPILYFMSMRLSPLLSS